ncbi:NAD(P)-binding protein [Pandoraea fibrosis]|uniref:NAD(P)-binding protein n=1 Tax=Pandoraea fibrosis TaxID=1891094 RepID=A0ABX6HTF7_9BURK|nr:FAD-dependent monooxygenase [Pandoraea fibrosis]QHE92551.1 NAD(P)-binding protein [Pandoraea fibrosis]QHF13893.1 NAD(P)-binding protein [Pandoraea fibrosis]
MDCDVLIVGAGPVGLFLATSLAQQGLRVEVFDAKSGTSKHPAANANSARTMEHFRRIGVSAHIRQLGLPPDQSPDVAYFTTISGHELARLSQPASRDAVAYAKAHSFTWPTPEPPHRCSQLYIEPVLLDAARRQSTCNVHFDATVTDLVQDADGVSAVITLSETPDRPAQVRRVRARYAVGCDGPRSFVRRSLGLRYGGVASEKRAFMGGQMDAVYFYAPTLVEASGKAPAWQYWTFGPTQRALIVAVDGRGHFIMNVQRHDDETPSDDVVRSRIAQALGADIPFEVKSASAWTAGHALVAERLVVGRVFLCGDAAHLFTPTGGLGYNTGIDDAANLAWKLVALVRGNAGEALAQSYDAERRPAGERNTAFARNFADSIGYVALPREAYEPGPDGDAARHAVGEYLAFHARHEFVIPGVHLGTRYESSPLLVAEPGSPPADNANLYVPCARPGHRAPHAWLADGSSLYDAMGQQFTLLCVDAQTPEASAVQTARDVLGDVVVVMPTLADVARLRRLYERSYVLIRPDLHVAWRGDTLDDAFVMAARRCLALDAFEARAATPSANPMPDPILNS